MKTSEQKRIEAAERQAARNTRTREEQMDKLMREGHVRCKEYERLSNK